MFKAARLIVASGRVNEFVEGLNISKTDLPVSRGHQFLADCRTVRHPSRRLAGRNASKSVPCASANEFLGGCRTFKDPTHSLVFRVARPLDRSGWRGHEFFLCECRIFSDPVCPPVFRDVRAARKTNP